MPSRNQKPTLDPVVLVTLGIVFLALAFFMLTSLPQGGQEVSIDVTTSAWSQLITAFTLGLGTGGLSCLAMQGGLLASSLAHQIEKDYLEQIPQHKKRARPARPISPTPRTEPAYPIFLFLAAKLVSYTLLGALLGWIGSYLSLNPMSRAVLMFAIGIFMIGNALRMFNVHPIFLYFAIEPPKFITRYIRKTAKGTDTATPIFLGALTVFIPCGVTQAVMAVALGTGSLGLGAALMFAFTLGTSPVFFLAAYLTTQLGARLENFFMRFVAIIVLIFGLVTINGGLNLVGSPLSFNNLLLRQDVQRDAPGLVEYSDGSTSLAGSPANPAASGDVVLYVQNQGYFPRTLRVPGGSAFTLNLVTNQTYSCSRDFVIPALGFYQLLPDTGTVQVDIPAQPAGTRIFFTCSMGMYTGLIVFE